MNPVNIRWVAVLSLALSACGCLDNSERIRRERHEADEANRLVQVEDDLRRLQASCQALEGSLAESQLANDKLRHHIDTLEKAFREEQAKRPPVRTAEAAPPKRAPAPHREEPRAEGGELKRIQAALKRAGYDPGPLDGKMGQKTKTALLAFQKDNGLKPDGVVGEQTLAKLQPYLTETPAADPGAP